MDKLIKDYKWSCYELGADSKLSLYYRGKLLKQISDILSLVSGNVVFDTEVDMFTVNSKVNENGIEV